MFQALLRTLSPQLPQLWPLLYSIPRPWSSIQCFNSISATLIPTKVSQDLQPTPSQWEPSCPMASETYGHLLHSTDHFCFHVEFCPSPWMDKDLPHSALPFIGVACCLLSSMFDSKLCNPNTVPQNSGFCQNTPQMSSQPASLACCLSIINTRLTRFPNSWQTSLSYQQQIQSPREKRPTNQKTNPGT